MNKPVLIVEDDELQREMLATLLMRKLDFGAHKVANGREALDFLQSEKGSGIKLVILDLDMPVMGGMEALEIINQRYPHIAVIMLTGNADVSNAVNAMKLGATDFVSKPYEGDRLAVTVRNALRISTLTREVSRLKGEREGRFTFDNLIGHDSGLLHAVNIGRKAAGSDIPVLISGETGTGKEVFARAIHGEGGRAGKPFIAVNCGAIPDQLVESTLFGHEKGAFTGATDKVIGKFREAEGGTIFLDEVGELPRDAQVKLLRVLQQKEVEPVGAGKPVPINVRVISATNRDLEEEVKSGAFREDLFFRLNVLQIALPALRDRSQDVLSMAEHFIERFCVNEGAIPKMMSSRLDDVLLCYEWPGNVRQLENVINRAMVVSDGNVLDVNDFPSLVGGKDEAVFIQGDGRIGGANLQLDLMRSDNVLKTVDEIESEVIAAALQYYDHNVTQAAKALGMAKSTFYKKMKK